MNKNLLKNKKGLLIDIDDTLIYYERAHEKAINACFDYQKDDYINEKDEFIKKYTEKREIILKRLKGSGSSRSKLLAFQLLYDGDSIRLIEELDNLYWETLIFHTTPIKKGLQYIDWAFSNGFPICVVTDMILKYQIQKLQKINVLDKINYIVSSEEVGVEKPDPLIFQKGVQKIKLPVSHLVMVGNCLSKDAGCVNIGIDFIHIQS